MGSFKKAILFLHRWLGLISGLVVVILSVTGCLFAFQHEITGWLRSDLMHVDQEKTEQYEPLPMAALHQKASEALKVDRLPYGLTTYRDSSRNWSALLYTYNPDSWTYMGMAEEYKTLYINPYTGEIEGIVNEKKDFFQIVKGIHWSLLLATPIGQPIVVWSTVVFIILLISGLVLWWPKRWNKAGRKRSFTIKWRGSWRRVNYDLHNVLGLYFLLISLIIGLTGLYWYFPFAKKAIYFLGTGEYRLPPVPAEKVVSVPDQDSLQAPMDIAYANAWTEFPDAHRIEFLAPADSQGIITATIRAGSDTYYEKSTMQFDQYTGEVLDIAPYSEKNAGEKLLAMNYDIHVGAIGGLPGKIIAFFGSLLCASLPVTGFIIWWDREQRKKKRRTKPPVRRKGIRKKKVRKQKPVAS